MRCVRGFGVADPFTASTSEGGSADASIFGQSPVPAGSSPRTASKPSPLPLIVAIVALIASVALAVLFRDSFPAAIVGYLLTPFVVVGCVGWARGRHLNRLPDLWYDGPQGAKQLTMLQITSAVAFLIGFAHMWRIATEVASSWFV